MQLGSTDRNMHGKPELKRGDTIEKAVQRGKTHIKVL